MLKRVDKLNDKQLRILDIISDAVDIGIPLVFVFSIIFFLLDLAIS